MKINPSLADETVIPGLARNAVGAAGARVNLTRNLSNGRKTKTTVDSDHVIENGEPLQLLEFELRALRRDLRKTVRAYAARLEIALAQSAAVIARHRRDNRVPRALLHEIRDLTIMVQNRKLKIAGNGRKNLRAIDSLITELHLITHREDLRASDS